MDFECNICNDYFNMNDNKPIWLNCGHSLCFSCYDKSCRCPFCRKEFSRPFMVNYALQLVLEECNNYFNKDEIKRGKIIGFDFVIPDISYYVSEANKKLRQFLELDTNFPEKAIDCLTKNDNQKFWPVNFNTEDNRKIYNEYFSCLNVIVSDNFIFKIKSSKEEGISASESSSFYYHRYYSQNSILDDKWRNYLRREDENIAEIEVNYRRNENGKVEPIKKEYPRENKNVFENEIVACIVLTSDNIHLGKGFNKSFGYILWISNPKFEQNEFRFKINDGVSLLEEYDQYEEKKVALIRSYNEKNNLVEVIFDDNGQIAFDNWEQNKIKLA